jgi:hypothetical protein
MPVPACGNGRARAERPRARRSLLEGTFKWAASVGREGHRGVGRAPCALKKNALSFGFLQVLSGVSPFV